MSRLPVGRCCPFVLAVTAVGVAGLASPAQAQYSSGLWFYNPRTGMGFSQAWSLGNQSYSGGFAVVTPRYGFSTYSGYGPRQSWSSMQYGNRRYSYSQGWSMGRRRYRGGAAYIRH